MKKFVTITLVVVAVAALVTIVYLNGHKKNSVEPSARNAERQVSTAPDSAPSPAPAPATASSGQANPPHAQVALNNGTVAIDAQPLADGQAHFFTARLPAGNRVDFFVVKDGSGVFRAAADACQVCYQQKKGFHQEGTEMVCNNCGNRYPVEKIATEKGGCNPGPINPALQAAGGTITISQAELEQVAQLF